MLCANKIRYFGNVNVKRIVKSIGNMFFVNDTAFRHIPLREDMISLAFIYIKT
jgi:hypothetical protein